MYFNLTVLPTNNPRYVHLISGYMIGITMIGVINFHSRCARMFFFKTYTGIGGKLFWEVLNALNIKLLVVFGYPN